MLIALMLAALTAADTRVNDAIVQAVRARMGGVAEVSVEAVAVDSAIDGDAVRAVPDPGARLGRTIRFSLRGGDARARIGSATARVRVSVPHAHTTRAIDRGAELADADLVAATHDISAGPLRALPSFAQARQARTVQPLAANACVTAAAIAAVPAVRGGRDVAAVARIGDVEARTTVTASQNGDAGDIIRVVNRQTRRPLKARVISEGLVEIIHD